MKNDIFDNGYFERQFDQKWNSSMKLVRTGIFAIILMWILGAIVALTAIGGLAYVAIHFLSKVW